MTNEDRERAERELRTAAGNFIAALRLARGVDEVAFSRLKEAIIGLGDAWQVEDHLPKSAVNILVGLFSWIDSASHLYEGDDSMAIKQAAMDVETLIFQHVVPAP
ncbi:hypothetical protein [Streptosporangium sp. NPDC006007]|uniref:hypothetical protein n=1 Tax=Streptosporangium sp. NPDC006007 TaxID=3154575 RepID=UPI0033A4C773